MPRIFDRSRARETLSSGLTITAVLIAGFGITAGLWLIAWSGLASRMRDVESQTSAINDRYIRAQELLATVRAQVLLGSVLVRDVLLDPALARSPGYRDRFETTYRAADRALRQYVPVLDSADERAGIARLRQEVDDVHRDMAAVLDLDEAHLRQSVTVLRERILPRRDVALRISEQAQALNRRAFVTQSRATAQVYRAAQRHAWQRLIIAFAASLGIAAGAAAYARRLERRLRAQRERDRQLTGELHRLSGRLVNAQEDERRMIARELHDEVGQALATIRVELAAAARVTDAGVAAHRIGEVKRITEGALGAVRDLSHLLHPPALDELGLAAAIESLAAGFERRHGVITTAAIDAGIRRLTPGLEITLYRIVQEALNNIAAHASARSCRVELASTDADVTLSVEDDGAGFTAVPAGGTTGLGLIAIRERAAQYGGVLTIDSAPGRGTRLSVTVPAPPQLTSPPVTAAEAPPFHAEPTHLPR